MSLDTLCAEPVSQQGTQAARAVRGVGAARQAFIFPTWEPPGQEPFKGFLLPSAICVVV